MLPRIKKVEFRNVHIDDEIHTDNDILLTPDMVEKIDASSRPRREDVDRMMMHEPDVLIFGVGFRNKEADKSLHEYAKRSKVEVHFLPTPDAVRKYKELARKGKKVVAKLHITC